MNNQINSDTSIVKLLDNKGLELMCLTMIIGRFFNLYKSEVLYKGGFNSQVHH